MPECLSGYAYILDMHPKKLKSHLTSDVLMGGQPRHDGRVDFPLPDMIIHLLAIGLYFLQIFRGGCDESGCENNTILKWPGK